MVKMILSRASVDDTKSQDMVFQVPLISLLPIYPLGVDSVDVDFNMEVHPGIRF